MRIVDVTAEKYYGAGYQDVQSRVPWIRNTSEELDWAPKIDMQTAVRRIFESYRANLGDARALVDAA